MKSNRIAMSCGEQAASTLLACLCAGALFFTAAMAVAQDAANPPPPAAAPAPVQAPAQAQDRGFFGNIGHWFDQQAGNIKSGFKNAGSGVANFGHEAGVAAKSTVDTAKDAADAVVKIPIARVVAGHEKCALAPNGAPDCVAAANALCKAKGYTSGKSADMTTAEVCPAQVYLSGRSSGAGCHTETFISRALCQ
jgi:hypothetical protein